MAVGHAAAMFDCYKLGVMLKDFTESALLFHDISFVVDEIYLSMFSALEDHLCVPDVFTDIFPLYLRSRWLSI